MDSYESPQDSVPLIKATNLCLKTAQHVAYERLNLAIPCGKVTAICSSRPVSRAALLLTLTGRMSFNHGDLTVAGCVLPREAGKLRRIAGIGFFTGVNDVQTTAEVSNLIAAELALYGRPSGVDEASTYLQKWALETFANTRITDLGAENYVRLGCTLGMVGEPEILAVEDIETNLTQHQSRKLMAYLRLLASEGLTVLVGCTDYEIARSADAVVMLSAEVLEQREIVETELQEHHIRVLGDASSAASSSSEAPAIVGSVLGLGGDIQ